MSVSKILNNAESGGIQDGGLENGRVIQTVRAITFIYHYFRRRSSLFFVLLAA